MHSEPAEATGVQQSGLSDSLPESRGSGKRRAAESPDAPDTTRTRLNSILKFLYTTLNETLEMDDFSTAKEQESEYMRRWPIYQLTLAQNAIMKENLSQQQPYPPEFPHATIVKMKGQVESVQVIIEEAQKVLQKWLENQPQKTQSHLASMVPASVQLGPPREDRPSSRPNSRGSSNGSNKSKSGSLPEHHRDRLRD